jgi:hypothetical protein
MTVHVLVLMLAARTHRFSLTSSPTGMRKRPPEILALLVAWARCATLR